MLFVAGGKSYLLKDTLYTAHLEFCNDRLFIWSDIKKANDNRLYKSMSAFRIQR